MGSLSASEYLSTILILLLACVGIAMILKIRQAISEYRLSSQLEKDGIQVGAEIFDRYTDNSMFVRNLKAFVRYSYLFGQEEIEAKQQVSLSHYYRLPLGSKVSVRYMPHSPKIVRLSGNDVDNSVRDLALSQTVGGIVILFILYFFFGPLLFTGS